MLSESLRTSRAGSLRDSRNNNFEAKDTGISTNIQINSQAENIDYLSLPEPELRTKSSMSKMSIEEIAEHLEMAKNQEAGTGEDSSIDV